MARPVDAGKVPHMVQLVLIRGTFDCGEGAMLFGDLPSSQGCMVLALLPGDLLCSRVCLWLRILRCFAEACRFVGCFRFNEANSCELKASFS